MIKNIVILGSTGSIGRQTLEVIGHLGSGYRVLALTAGSNKELLAQQVRRYRPKIAVLRDEEAARELKKELENENCHIEAGLQGQMAAAALEEADLVFAATVGFSGFEPLINALKNGKRIALANKESLVVGGELLERKGLLLRDRILPVDSEHSAIWQCLAGSDATQIQKVFLTASGGPFRELNLDSLAHVTPGQALAHPNWKMGDKITIDSATMMNKGFEVMEARWLFNLEFSKIQVIVHPESIIHSAVEFMDGSVIAQLGLPDMRLPIQYALTYPERKPGLQPGLDLIGRNLTFHEPDRTAFPCLDLAYRAGEAGGTFPACLNGANEVAVKNFLMNELSFNGIPRLIEAVLDRHEPFYKPGVEDIVEADRWARETAGSLIGKIR